jgi:hypothetical protein
LGQASITYSGSGEVFNITNQKMMNVTIITVGTDDDDDIYADQLAANIEASLATNASRQILCAGGLAVFNTPTISNVSVEIETGFEERYAVEVNFGYCSQVTDDTLGCIEKVQDAQGTVSGGAEGDQTEVFTVVKP